MAGVTDLPPTCWYCGSVQPHSYAPGRYVACVYCGVDLARQPGLQTRWVATTPPNTPAGPRPRRIRARYAPPPPYRTPPRWGFQPSVWMQPAPPGPPPPPAPVRDLRSASVLATATAVLYVVAAAAEAWRFALLMRGRTEVLWEPTVRFSDALVTAAGWVALIAAIATALSLLPTTARTIEFAARRAAVRPTRTDGQRLRLLLIPGWNLYGAGVVFGEIDGLLRLPIRDDRPATVSRFGWRSRELPDVGSASHPQASPPEDARAACGRSCRSAPWSVGQLVVDLLGIQRCARCCGAAACADPR